jgi:hypothetical protein
MLPKLLQELEPAGLSGHHARIGVAIATIALARKMSLLIKKIFENYCVNSNLAKL